MTSRFLSISGLVVGLCLFLAVNILGETSLRSARLDLTEGKHYTLSDGTKQLVAKLSEPVTLRFYYSASLVQGYPGIETFARRIRETLEEIADASNGKILFEVIDPEPFTPKEDQAVEQGLQGIPLGGGASIAYLGLAASNTIGQEETIPFFSPDREQFLEYDLARIIHKLGTSDKIVVGVMSWLPIDGQPQPPQQMPFMQQPAGSEPWAIMAQLRELFEVKNVGIDEAEIPAEIDVLLVVHPKDPSPQTVYALDQFALRGGRLVLFVDPVAEQDEAPTDPSNPMNQFNYPRASDLKTLLNHWGVELVPNRIAGDNELAMQVRTGRQQRPELVSYIPWIGFKSPNLNKDDAITGTLNNIVVGSAGYFRPYKSESIEGQPAAEAPKPLTMTPLIQTTDQAMEVDSAKVTMFPDPKELLANYVPGKAKLTVAARLEGNATTAFPQGPPPPPADPQNPDVVTTPDAELVAKQLKQSEQPLHVVIVADADLLADQFWVQMQNMLGMKIAIPISENASFVSNIIENLGGSDDLISIRGRQSFSRPFSVMQDMAKDASVKFEKKEQELREALKEAETKIAQLEGGPGSTPGQSNSFILTPEQRDEVEKYRDEKLRIRKDLREVRYNLNKDIDNLKNRVKLYNIAAVPVIVAIGAILMGMARNRRRFRRSQG